MEKNNKIERSKLYNEILEIVKQIPRKELICDASDALSVAHELEQFFLKLISTQNINQQSKLLTDFCNYIYKMHKIGYEAHINGFIKIFNNINHN